MVIKQARRDYSAVPALDAQQNQKSEVGLRYIAHGFIVLKNNVFSNFFCVIQIEY